MIYLSTKECVLTNYTAALPIGRAVKITPEAIDAAAAGDVALLALLFAEEVEPDEIDLAVLRDIDADNHDGAKARLIRNRAFQRFVG